MHKKVFKNPEYFDNEAAMTALFSPLHKPVPPEEFKPLNVVVIIWESLGKESTGFFNTGLEGGTYTGFTPFLDSLFAQGLTFKYSYCNGSKSIDAMPSILSSIPMFVEPFILTSYSTNDISSLADALKQKGYYSAFFHGAPSGSMGFEAYAKIAGFDDYFGFENYNNSSDFDGTWAIWDEEFLQFFAAEMGKMKQPFVTSVFTASSHHPFNIPKKYKDRFPQGKHPILQCIAYTDYAIRQFFVKMSQYEWYNNTLFVICADHTNQPVHEEYFTNIGRYSIPILFYHPDSNLKGLVDSIPVQQTDIMPSVLSYLNYDKPFFAYGQDVFTTNAADKFVINYNTGTYQLLQNNFLHQFDGETTKAIYDYKTDSLLRNNIIGQVESRDETELLIKSVVQQYLMRMLENRLRVSE
jgi:phosphoglycerol transferase MdoB-like AlkP superfamily enzyme